MINVNCPSCNCQKTSFSFKGVSSTRNPYILAFCQNCGLLYNTCPLQVDYTTYKDYKLEIGNTSNSFERRTSYNGFAFNRFSWILSQIHHHSLSIPTSVLEVGTYDGANLYPFKLINSDCYGVDLCTQSFSDATSLGITMTSSIDYEKSYDLVIISHVLEHIEDLTFFFDQFSSPSFESSLFYIEVPGLYRWFCRSYQSPPYPYCATDRLSRYVMDEHINYFCMATLSTFLNSRGLRILSSDEQIRVLAIKDSSVTSIFDSPESLISTQYKYVRKIIYSRFSLKSFIYKISCLIQSILHSSLS